MHPDERLNLAAIPPIVDHLVRSRVGGLFVCGSTGEGPSLASDEREAVAAAYVQAAAGRVPVIVHVGHTSLVEARRLAEHAASIGADAIAALPPWYFKPRTVEEVVDCLAPIAAAAPALSLYYYHLPAFTGVQIAGLDLLRLGGQRLPTLAGIKYSDLTVPDLQACAAYAGGRFNLLFGVDEMLLAGLSAGAQGGVGSTFNLAAPLYHRIIAAYERGDLAEARRLQLHAVELVNALAPYGMHAALKASMSFLGLECGPVRRPLAALGPADLAALRRDLETIGFFEWAQEPAAVV
jgi:N-acetylneuraminate lyase